MTSFIIEHQCPQCGAPAELEETDRLFNCDFCRVSSYLTVPDVFRYILPNNAPSDKSLFYFPYWRFKGMLFTCIRGKIDSRYIDISRQAIASPHVPYSLGFRSQTQKLRFATGDMPGTFLKPTLSKAALLNSLNDRFGPKPQKGLLHQAQIGETVSLLYAPLYLDGKLIDGILNKAVCQAPLAQISPLLENGQAPDWPLNFVPALCPECGWDLEGHKDALALNCDNCQTMWWARGGKLEKLTAAHTPDSSDQTVHIPFWRIKADIDGVELNSYADLIRVANQPKVAQPGWDKLPFYFWIPAFKANPHRFLTLASQVTAYQPGAPLDAGHPKGRRQGVNLPVQEAIESLELILAASIRPHRRAEELLKVLQIKARRLLLVYLPFREGPHDLVHQEMKIGISKGLLAHAKDL